MLTDTEKQKIREELAEIEHQQWEDWSRNLVTTEKISPERVMRWNKLWRPYDTLTEEEKDQDRKYADKVIAILDKTIKSKLEAVEGEIEKVYILKEKDQSGRVVASESYEFSPFSKGYNRALDYIKTIINKHK